MKIIRDIEQGTPEWLALRVGVLTSTDFQAVLAKGPKGKPAKTRLDLIDRLATERITGRSAEDGFCNKWMNRGHEREAAARSLYEIQTGYEVEQVAFISDGDIGASPDGLVGDDGMVEIKCVKLSVHLAYIRRGDLPPEHKRQIQGQLMVSARNWCDFISYCPESNLELWVFRVERDPDYIEQLDIACRLLLAEVDHTEKELRGYMENPE